MPTSRKATRRFDLIFYGAILLVRSIIKHTNLCSVFNAIINTLFTLIIRLQMCFSMDGYCHSWQLCSLLFSQNAFISILEQK